MSPPEPPSPERPRAGRAAASLLRVALAAAVGAAGAALAPAPGSADGHIAAGALFGLAAGLALGEEAASPGAGIIWGLGGSFLLWLALPAAAHLAGVAGLSRGAMLGEARAWFGALVRCVVFVGAPVGLFLGAWAALRRRAPGRFRWARALVAGGAAGVAAALIFSRWMYVGGFYPLISGYGAPASQGAAVGLHFLAACAIGCTFGILFQSDVRNAGSAMGWGMAYSIFWWFLAQIVVLPAAAGAGADWSAERAGRLFGALVGHILFGLILGIVYAAADAAWRRLFVEADPLNRRRQGPGVHVVLSLGWGSAAGLCGGLVALPLMVRAGAFSPAAGLDLGLGAPAAVALHLALSAAIGASYGVLFKGEASSGVYGSFWGLLFGLIWWYAGPLTLLPLLRTGECDWRPQAAAALMPSLVGHLIFGLVTANVFLAFERRYNRWLLRDPRQAALAAGRARAGADPAPALWVFVLGLGVLLPVVLS